LSFLVPPRYGGEELIDRPGLPRAEIDEALRDIQWVNRRLGGWSAVRRYLPRLLQAIPPGRPLRVLDLGTGSADLPRRIAAFCANAGRPAMVVGVDMSPEVLEFARRECAAEKAVRLVRADVLRLPFRHAAFDLVLCSLLLHHFAPAAAVRLLREMAAFSRGAVLVNDLERHRAAHVGIWILSRLQRRGRLFRHDAPVSVLRAYRLEELRGLLGDAGLAHLQVDRVRPFRLCIHGTAARRGAR
jgi:SAM-dependent methyltransferase